MHETKKERQSKRPHDALWPSPRPRRGHAEKPTPFRLASHVKTPALGTASRLLYSSGGGIGIGASSVAATSAAEATGASATTRPTAPSGSRRSRGPEEVGGALAVMTFSPVAFWVMLTNSSSALVPYSTVPKAESAELCSVRALGRLREAERVEPLLAVKRVASGADLVVVRRP